MYANTNGPIFEDNSFFVKFEQTKTNISALKLTDLLVKLLSMS